MQNHDEKLSAWDSSWRKTTELVARSVQSCFKHPQNKLQHPRTAVAEAQFRKPSRAIQRQSCASMCQQGCAIHSCIRGLSLCSQLCSITVNDVLSQFNMKPQPNHAVPKDIVNSACGPLTLGFKFSFWANHFPSRDEEEEYQPVLHFKMDKFWSETLDRVQNASRSHPKKGCHKIIDIILSYKNMIGT